MNTLKSKYFWNAFPSNFTIFTYEFHLGSVRFLSCWNNYTLHSFRYEINFDVVTMYHRCIILYQLTHTCWEACCSLLHDKTPTLLRYLFGCVRFILCSVLICQYCSMWITLGNSKKKKKKMPALSQLFETNF